MYDKFMVDTLKKGECIMNKNIMFLIFGLLSTVFMIDGSWFVVAIDNSSDLTLSKALRADNIEIPSISQIFMQTKNQHAITIPIDLSFGSLAGCAIVGQNQQGQSITFSLFGDSAYRVANGRAQFTDLASRNAATNLLSLNLARVFVLLPDGTMQLAGFAGYEQNNQPIALTLTGSAGNYQVSCTLIK